MSNFGLTTAGEFSNAINDCGLYVNGVGLGTRYEGTFAGSGSRIGSCDQWTNYKEWDATMKSQIMTFALASMDALQVSISVPQKVGICAKFQCSTELVLLDVEDRELFSHG